MLTIAEQSEISYLCPECNGNLVPISEKGETVCGQCGLVISERELDSSRSGKRIYNTHKTNESQIRYPISPLLADIGLCTFIDKKGVNNTEFRRIVKRDSCLTWESRNFLIASTEIKRISHILNLPTYVKEASLKLYKKTYNKSLLRGRSINGMVAACVYYICKMKRIPRTLQEVIGESSASKENIMSCFKILIKELNLRVPLTNPISLIPKYCTDLSLSHDVENIAIKVLESYSKRYPLGGVDPKGLCAGAIYLASKMKNQRINQIKIARVVGTSEVTLRSRYRELMSSIEL